MDGKLIFTIFVALSAALIWSWILRQHKYYKEGL